MFERPRKLYQDANFSVWQETSDTWPNIYVPGDGDLYLPTLDDGTMCVSTSLSGAIVIFLSPA